MALHLSSTRFVGRKEELVRLGAALTAAGQRSPGAVLIAGEAGVGKTRLVQEFAGRVGAEAQVLLGRCINLSGGGLPYGPIVDALRGLARDADLDPLLSDLAGLLPGAAPPKRPVEQAGEFAQARLFELVLRLLDRISERRPVLLVLEDVHWADRTTLDLLRFVVGMVRRERLLIVATYRSDELHPRHPLRSTLAELDRSRRVEHLQLPRFDRPALSALLDSMLGRPPPPDTVERIFARSLGNAFLAEELVAAGAGGPRWELPLRLQQLLVARTEGLAEDTRHVLWVAATIGRPIEHRLLAAASQLTEPRLLAAIREAVDRQLLVAEREAYVFRHTLLQEAVYEDLLPGERRRLHAAVARALTDSSPAALHHATAVELAHHWHAAHCDLEALEASIRAGRAAADISGFVEAHHQFERALQLWQRVPDAEAQVGVALPELLLEAAEAAHWAGADERAATQTQEAVADLGSGIGPAQAGVLYARLGGYLWDAGHGKAALAAHEEACRLVASEAASAEKADVLAAHGQVLMREGQYRASRVRCEEAIAVARSVGARAQEGHALNTLGVDLAVLGDPESGIAALRQARAVAEEVGAFEDIFRAYTNLGGVVGDVGGRLEEGVELSRQGLERMRQLGLECALPGNVFRGDLAWGLWLLGRGQEAAELATEALARELPLRFALHMQLLQGRLHLAQGQFDLAQAQGEIAVRTVEQMTDTVQHALVQEYLAELATWGGDHDAARSAVARGLGYLAGSDEVMSVTWLCSIGLRAEADAAECTFGQRAVREPPAIRTVAERLVTQVRQVVAERGPGGLEPQASAHAAGCEAEFSRLERKSDPQLWAGLVATWDGLCRPYEAAYARWRYAEALLTAKAPRVAADVLRGAHQAAIELGARPLCHEIERLARRARIDLRPATAKAKTVSTAHGFTPREQQVLQHLVEGRTNRQIARALFINEKTASVHVSNIMRKLGAANRAEAAAIAHRLRLVSEPSQA
jgi:DNA-binding CsgD family transcriptional regulator